MGDDESELVLVAGDEFLVVEEGRVLQPEEELSSFLLLSLKERKEDWKSRKLINPHVGKLVVIWKR
jgi:hypothetical protein